MDITSPLDAGRSRQDSDEDSDNSGPSPSGSTSGTNGSCSTATSSPSREAPLELSELPFSRTDILLKNTFVDDYSHGHDEQAATDILGLRPRADTEWSGLMRLASQDVKTVFFDSSRPKEDVTATSVEVAATLNGEYARMICFVELASSTDGTISASVMPCTTPEAVAAAQAAGTATEMWCWLQPDAHGNIMAIPCNDRPYYEMEQAPTAAELACAPAPPAAGSYKPAWVPGYWGHVCAPPTTLVIDNLPASLTQEAFLEVLDRADFSGFYDFVFLESDPSTGRTCGSAVVNLTRHEYALVLAAKFHGRTAWPASGEDEAVNPCKVEWSLPLQGLYDLINKYRDHPLNDTVVPEELRPQLFKDGWPLAFPVSH